MVKSELHELQRLACVYNTGAMKTTRSASFEIILIILPLHLDKEEIAIIGAVPIGYNTMAGGKRKIGTVSTPIVFNITLVAMVSVTI